MLDLLVLAAGEGNETEVSRLLSNGVSPNPLTDAEASPLMIAAYRGFLGIVTLLIKANAQLNYMDLEGCSAMYLACSYGHDNVVRVLLKAGASLEPLAGAPILAAAEEGHLSVVLTLIEHGVDIEVVDSEGCTALWLACSNAHDSVVRVLLTQGACGLETANYHGITPLAIAQYLNHHSIVKLLLAAGANSFENNEKETEIRSVSRTEKHTSMNFDTKLSLSKLSTVGRQMSAPIHGYGTEEPSTLDRETAPMKSKNRKSGIRVRGSSFNGRKQLYKSVSMDVSAPVQMLRTGSYYKQLR